MKSASAADSLLMFVTGFAVGAGVALLAAPQSGRRTRRQILRRAEDAQEYLEEIGEDLIDRGRELVERARSEVQQKVKEVGA